MRMERNALNLSLPIDLFSTHEKFSSIFVYSKYSIQNIPFVLN
jgi:hypothetical protein